MKIDTELAQTFAIMYDRMTTVAVARVYQRKPAWSRKEVAQQPETQNWPFEYAALFDWYQDNRNDGMSHEVAIAKAEKQFS